ncbi:maleylpyruvate isomerase family mycothiol-dependent enzyme [Nocardia sp. XZ_19_385]|uniref:maleylpyruvate isomerase family mycothiol-dependent enzyme n=1 Tax=Nocardia sp. XZ_19_385 TaxID=2769488 RepID=UPI00188EE5CE|nr:maleylpyruvate isomerase family mycothiol-dependent enzyme [Nocardia sp. XZ_19_385]
MGIRELLASERLELVTLLRTLTDEEWETPSLCAGWKVRDVIGHLLYDDVGALAYGAVIARNGFSIDKANAYLVRKARALSTTQLVDKFEAADGTLSKYSPTLALADTLVHQQDIRRPLGRPRTISADRLKLVLDHPDPFAFPWKRTKGLRFVATDLDWAKGRGPEVRGPGEALVLAVGGRPVVLDELAGDGVAELRRRCA